MSDKKIFIGIYARVVFSLNYGAMHMIFGQKSIVATKNLFPHLIHHDHVVLICTLILMKSKWGNKCLICGHNLTKLISNYFFVCLFFTKKTKYIYLSIFSE